MRMEFERLVNTYGSEFLPLYEEEGVYNFYLNGVVEIAAVASAVKPHISSGEAILASSSTAGASGSSSSGNRRREHP